MQFRRHSQCSRASWMGWRKILGAHADGRAPLQVGTQRRSVTWPFRGCANVAPRTRGETLSESLARDCRLVPSVGVVLAAGDPGHRSLALAVAPVAAVSRGWNYIRRPVRAPAGDPVSPGASVRIPR